MLYYDQKWKLAYSLIIIRFPFKVHQFKQHWGKIAGEIFLSSVTYLKRANPSCFMLGIQGKGNICPLTLRMFIFTVPEKASVECFNLTGWFINCTGLQPDLFFPLLQVTLGIGSVLVVTWAVWQDVLNSYCGCASHPHLRLTNEPSPVDLSSPGLALYAAHFWGLWSMWRGQGIILWLCHLSQSAVTQLWLLSASRGIVGTYLRDVLQCIS